ncbi:SDR family oxidoreductase [Phytoactinopolyspora halotolerans]|uniref:SDR family oxidoreductase n=1 Tax=Phytoactinopolyspora halotolerans TaxID=1981512 RepID=A0A6L9SJ32_9ACTN|nr:SDR family oxidoreductase [Phytoactinopolyspora halotolerans]NEE04422.1 SDR family oxidoreductase [Phytoactinopolyspora halotolerans]
MSKPLMGKNALVTGASKGIGRALAVRLGQDGAVVAVHYNSDAEGAKETVHEIERHGGHAVAIHADLAADDAPESVLAGLDSVLGSHVAPAELDIVVHNAGVGESSDVESLTLAEYERLFAVNVRAPLFVTQRLLPRLRDGGRVVNISSGVARIAMPAIMPYAMTKGALEVFTFQLAQQLGSRGITVNAVAPGVVVNDRTRDQMRANPGFADYARELSALKRLGEPEDVAGVVAFLCSDDGRWVTGQVLDATGGAHL